MTWMERGTDSMPAKLVAAAAAAFLLAAGHLNHVIVVSLEVFAALHGGAPFGYADWLAAAAWAALGNAVGGLGLVTALRVVQVGADVIAEERQRPGDESRAGEPSAPTRRRCHGGGATRQGLASPSIAAQPRGPSQPMRSAATVAGVSGQSRNSSRIFGVSATGQGSLSDGLRLDIGRPGSRSPPALEPRTRPGGGRSSLARLGPGCGRSGAGGPPHPSPAVRGASDGTPKSSGGHGRDLPALGGAAPADFGACRAVLHPTALA